MHVLEAYWVALLSSTGPRSWKLHFKSCCQTSPHIGHHHPPQGNRYSAANTPNPRHTVLLPDPSALLPQNGPQLLPPSPHPTPCLRCSLLLHVTRFWFTPVREQVRLTSRCPGVYPCPHYRESETYLIFIYKVGGGLLSYKVGDLQGVWVPRNQTEWQTSTSEYRGRIEENPKCLFPSSFSFLKQGTKKNPKKTKKSQ